MASASATTDEDDADCLASVSGEQKNCNFSSDLDFEASLRRQMSCYSFLKIFISCSGSHG